MINKAPDAQQRYSGVLRIFGLELEVNLGVPDEERSERQKVMLDVTIADECSSSLGYEDEPSQVVCYDEVICTILDKLKDKQFQLVEYLAQFIMNVLEKEFFSKNNITVQVLKKPVIRGVERNIKFELNNF